MPEIALAGQERIGAARVLCVGAGGLGCAALAYLAAAGVGTLGIIDDDRVDVSNLQRQILFTQADIGRLKAEVAAERLHAQNPEIEIIVMPYRLTPENATAIISAYDLVVDGSDSFTTRYLVNDACVLARRANIFASIYRFGAQCTVFAARGGPCYRCLFPEPPATTLNCAEGGVLGAVAGIAGTWQAAQALLLLSGASRPAFGVLHVTDVLAGSTLALGYAADPACAACGPEAVIRDIDPRRYAEAPAPAADAIDIAPEDVDAARAAGAVLLDVREPHEAALGPIAGALHVPFSQFDARLCELDPGARYIVACRVGARSAYAIARLRDAGIRDVRHLRAGLLRYAALAAADDVV